MAIDRDDVIDLAGELFLVTRTEQERRFGLEGEPKFWVKRAVSLTTGRRHILKLVFDETFDVDVGALRIRCRRSAAKEARVLDLMRDDDRCMQGRAVRDAAGNLVRVIDFIEGVDLLTYIGALAMPHEQYFHDLFPGLFAKTIGAVRAIGRLHAEGLCHGDIRNDHILIERGTGRFRWIDFDLDQAAPDYDIWALGNILHCVAGKGFVTFQETLRDRPELAGAERDLAPCVFFPNRID